MKYKCIIFDCDGVLVDSEPIAHQVIVELANSYGANLTYEEAHDRFAGTFLSHVIAEIEKLIGKKIPDNFESEYRRISFDRFKKFIQPIEGVKQLLKKLNAPICVASNGPLNKMELTLSTTNLISHFNGNLFSAYQVNAWKPNPTLFLHAAKNMGYSPTDCLVIEDSLSGVKAAISGGFDVVALGNKKNRKELETVGARVFFSINEIEKYLFNRVD